MKDFPTWFYRSLGNIEFRFTQMYNHKALGAQIILSRLQSIFFSLNLVKSSLPTILQQSLRNNGRCIFAIEDLSRLVYLYLVFSTYFHWWIPPRLLYISIFSFQNQSPQQEIQTSTLLELGEQLLSMTNNHIGTFSSPLLHVYPNSTNAQYPVFSRLKFIVTKFQF